MNPNLKVICDVCGASIRWADSKECIKSIQWGSISGSAIYGRCCLAHDTDAGGYIVGRRYA